MNAKKRLTPAEQIAAEKAESERIEKAIKTFLTHDKLKVYLDTNILIAASSDRPVQRDAIHQFCLQNDTNISDTVYWEFLRNCNVETYRKKRIILENILGDSKRIHRDDEVVEKHFAQLVFLYLYVLRDEPKKQPDRNINDLWIAAACISKCDYLLTCEHEKSRDFLPELFDDESFDLGRNIRVHLKTFKRKEAGEFWKAMVDSKVLELKFEDHWT